jgi:hypothetical protein
MYLEGRSSGFCSPAALVLLFSVPPAIVSLHAHKVDNHFCGRFSMPWILFPASLAPFVACLGVCLGPACTLVQTRQMLLVAQQAATA